MEECAIDPSSSYTEMRISVLTAAKFQEVISDSRFTESDSISNSSMKQNVSKLVDDHSSVIVSILAIHVVCYIYHSDTEVSVFSQDDI